MALSYVETALQLNIYDYDSSSKSMKTIAYDKKTRFVEAKLYKREDEYDIPADSTVTLYAVRPDKVGVIMDGSVVEVSSESAGETTIHGVYAELTQAALCVQGNIRAQFKIEYGSGDDHQILRTEIFIIKNGEALDASTSDWSGTYHGVPLDELIEQLEDINSNLAPLYNAESTYAVGDYVMHDNKLYKCTTAIATAEEWDATHWERCSVMSELMPNINFEQVSF